MDQEVQIDTIFLNEVGGSQKMRNNLMDQGSVMKVKRVNKKIFIGFVGSSESDSGLRQGGKL